MDGLRHVISAILLGACAVFLTADCRAWADASAPPDASAADDGAVKSGGDALKNENHYAWYDTKHDALRPVEFPRTNGEGKFRPEKVRKHRDASQDSTSSDGSTGNGSSSGNDSGNRSPTENSSPQENSSSPENSSPSENDSSQPDDSPRSGSSIPSISAPWLIWVAWIVIGGILIALAVALVRAFLNREAREIKASTSELTEIDDGDKLEALPTPATLPKGGLLDEVRRRYEAGDYNTAIIYLYAYQLLRLDQNQLLRLAKGKTNRQYLRELSGHGELHGVLARTIAPFEDVYFGGHPLDRARFEVCWSDVERFDSLVDRSST